MSLHKPNSPALPAGFLPEQLPITRVLYEAEIPVVYLSETALGQPLLAYVADDNKEGLFTLLVLISEKTINAIELGTMGVREALSLAQPWLHWTDGRSVSAWPISIHDVPTKHLPHEHFLLDPNREPVFRTRAVGETIVQGHMPASVVAFVADATRKAFKAVLDYTFAENTDGRPRDEHRTLYDLPIQSFAFSSFELSFGAPDEGMFSRQEIKDAASKLELGLLWASGDYGTELPADPEEREVFLRAALLLTPPSAGPISEIHISGTWVGSDDLVLTRASRKRVRSELRTVESEQIFTHGGRLEEIDVGKFTFILRHTSDGIERKGSFVEDLLDEMLAFVNEEVIIAGVESRGRLVVNAVVEGRMNP